MNAPSATSEIAEAAARAFRSALVIACALSLALAVYSIGEGERLAEPRQQALFSVQSPSEARSIPPDVQIHPKTGEHPLLIIPPRSHSFDRSGELTDHPDVWPVLVHRVAPEYTEVARKARVSGIVVVEAIIDSEGHVGEVRVAKPLPFGLDQKAAEAVRQWKFRPGTVEGKPVPVIMKLTVRFDPGAKP